MTIDEIKRASVEFTYQERKELAHFFFDGLGEESEEECVGEYDGFATAEIRDAWAAEIERRVEELESGKVKGVPYEEVIKKLREKYREANHTS